MRRFLLALGLFGFAAQALLARQFMAVFAGNELTLGIAVSAWLFWEAVGAWVAGLGRSEGRRPGADSGTTRREPGSGLAFFAGLSVAVTLAAVAVVVVVRRLAGLSPGETLPIPALVPVIFVASSLPALLHGALFVRAAGRLGSGGRAYLFEGAGTALGGLLLAAALAVGAPALPMLALSAIPLVLARRPWPRPPALALALLLLVAAALGARVESWLWQLAWPGHSVSSVADSRSGRIVVLVRAGARTVLYDGVPVPAVEPATLAGEELGVVPLLACLRPERLLLVGSGSAPVAAAALRFPEVSVTIAQPDARLTAALASAGSTARALLMGPSRRVRVVVKDAVNLLKDRERFDCIVVAEPTAATLAASRFHSPDFYRRCRARLRTGGVLALPGPGDPAALAPDAAGLLASREAALRRSFACVTTLPLDFPLTLAGDGPLAVAGSQLPDAPGLLDSAYLAALLDPMRADLLGRRIAASAGPRSRSEFLLSLLAETRLASSGFGRLYERVTSRSPLVFWLLVGVLLLAVLLAGRRLGPGFSRGWAVLTSGFAGAAVPTLVLFLWQLRFGTAYSGLVCLLAAFMLGTVVGSWVGTRVAARSGSHRFAFAAADLALVAAAAGLLTPVPGPVLVAVDSLAGLVLGLQFALAAAGPDRVRMRTSAVTVLDLAGGCAGGLLTALLLVPMLGVGTAALAVAAAKLTSFAGLASGGRRGDLTA